MEKDNEITEDKLDYFYESQTKIHVDLIDFTFLNGTIINKLKRGVFWLREDKLGEIFLFTREVRSIKQFKELKDVKN